MLRYTGKDYDDTYDHVTTVTAKGEVHPSSSADKIRMNETGSLDQYAIKKVNKSYNWISVLWD